MELLDQLAAQIANHSLITAIIAIIGATLFSEDLTCIAAGLLVARGDVPAAAAMAACIVGLFIGDVGLYGWGILVGRPALGKRPLRWWIKKEDVEKSAEWFSRRGAIVIFLARMIPGSRLPTYFAAGVLKTNFWKFCLYTFLATFFWAPLLVALAMVVGTQILDYIVVFEKYALLSLAILALGLLLAVKIIVPLFNYRGRRLLYSSFLRKVRWEYWSPLLFYVPVVIHILRLSLRYRSVSLFTTVNPSIHAGGFVNESKSEILAGLGKFPEFVAPAARIEASLAPGERLARALEFMRERDLSFPVVLKPDAGQRGSGVSMIGGEREMGDYLAKTEVDTIVQEAVPGHEFGIFYYRYPDQARGRIFSITEKRFPVVVGDGERTLERLILDDPKTIAMAPHYLRNVAHRLFEVPPEGEEIRLVEIGNHCRGSIFLDGMWVWTAQLEETIDRISRSFEGFYFGRYDVRTPSIEAFREGTSFKIVELNGATSEATHIYDPNLGLIDAYRTLFAQWTVLFEIAAQNRSRGARSVPLRELARLTLQYRRAARTHPA